MVEGLILRVVKRGDSASFGIRNSTSRENDPIVGIAADYVAGLGIDDWRILVV